MNIGEMFGQSAELTMLGMGVVFGFLIVLVICITIAGRVIHALGRDREAVPAALPARAAPAGNDKAVIAAIGAAVTQYINK